MVKVCIRPERVVGFTDPHLPYPLLGYKVENTDGEEVKSPNSKHLPADKSLRIFHYFLKSKEDFIRKVNKGFADRVDNYQLSIFEKYDRNECFNDNAIKIWNSHSE